MGFKDLMCKKSIIDALPTNTQRALASKLVCGYTFNKYNLVDFWYGYFEQDIYKLGTLMVIVITLYGAILISLSQKIMVPTFLSTKKKLKVTSIFMSGIIYPIIFNYSNILNPIEWPELNYHYSILNVSILVGSSIALMSVIFGVLHHFSIGEISMPAYPIYICFSFMAIGFLTMLVNGIYGKVSWVFSAVLLVAYSVYIFAIQWAEKKEVEQLEKARKADEALENFQRMMGGGNETEDLVTPEMLKKVREAKAQAQAQEGKVEQSTTEKIIGIAFDPTNMFIQNIIVGPIIICLCFFVPFKGNPLMKTAIQPLIVSVGIYVIILINTNLLVWWVQLIIAAVLITLYLVFKNFAFSQNFIKLTCSFLSIVLIFSLVTILQLWVDDAISFFMFYFSLDFGTGNALLSAFKGILIDTSINIQLVRLGEKESLLNSYTSSLFALLVVYPCHNLFSVYYNNPWFELFSKKNDEQQFLIPNGEVTAVTRTYLKILFGFVLILMTVKMIYYIVSDFKLNVYLRRTLYSIYVTFFFMSFYYGTLSHFESEE